MKDFMTNYEQNTSSEKVVEDFDNSLIMLTQLTNESRNKKINMKTSFSDEVFIDSVKKCIKRYAIDSK